MKNAIVCALLALTGSLCTAAGDAGTSGLRVLRVPLGSGTPANGPTTGTQEARWVADGDFHVPNHLPGHPTAASIWPREVEISCVQDVASGALVCDGYDVHPALGRGEYIYVRPVLRPPVAEPQPAPITEVIVVTPPCCCPPKAPPSLKKPRG